MNVFSKGGDREERGVKKSAADASGLFIDKF
jgi:hypothetical protein